MSKLILERIQEQFGAAVLETSSFRGDDVALVKPEHWRAVAEFVLRDARCQCDYFVDLSCVDRCDPSTDDLEADDRFEVYLIVYSVAKKHRVRLKTRVGGEAPTVDSVASVYAGANWMEREVWDMFGVRFEGHGDLRRILLYEEFQGHPLRKDYPAGRTQPLVAYREGTHDKLGPFLSDEGMPLNRAPETQFVTDAPALDRTPRSDQND